MERPHRGTLTTVGRHANRRPARKWDVSQFEPLVPTPRDEPVWLQPFPDALHEGAVDLPLRWAPFPFETREEDAVARAPLPLPFRDGACVPLPLREGACAPLPLREGA